MLVNCKACGKEIAKGVKKCVNCGADQRNFLGRHKILTGILALAIIIGIGSAMGDGGKSSSTQAPATTAAPAPVPAPVVAPANDPNMSKAEFDKIQNGMTYEAVVKIVGGPGEMTAETGAKGDDYYTVAYSFKGENGFGANAQLMFQGGKLNTKAQMGLK